MSGKIQMNKTLAATGIGIQSKNARRKNIQNTAAARTLKTQADIACVKTQTYRSSFIYAQMRQQKLLVRDRDASEVMCSTTVGHLTLKQAKSILAARQ